MLHAKFRRNRPTGSWKEECFTIYGHGSHLDHLTSIMLMIFYNLVPKSLYTKPGLKWPSVFFISLNLKAYIQNLVENGRVVSEKSKF